MKLKYDDGMESWDSLDREMRRRDLLLVLNGDAQGGLYADVANAEQEHVEKLALLLKTAEADNSSQFAKRTNDLTNSINSMIATCTFNLYVSKSAKGELIVDEALSASSGNNVGLAISGLISLLRGNDLVLLRKCMCGHWFQASRKGQQSCTTKCYLRRYQATNDAKTKRREYDKAAREGKFVSQEKSKSKVRVVNAKA